MRSGRVYIYRGNTWNIGTYGWSQSSTAATKYADGADLPANSSFGFDAKLARPSAGPFARWDAYPLGWLAGMGSGGGSQPNDELDSLE